MRTGGECEAGCLSSKTQEIIYKNFLVTHLAVLNETLDNVSMHPPVCSQIAPSTQPAARNGDIHAIKFQPTTSKGARPLGQV